MKWICKTERDTEKQGEVGRDRRANRDELSRVESVLDMQTNIHEINDWEVHRIPFPSLPKFIFVSEQVLLTFSAFSVLTTESNTDGNDAVMESSADQPIQPFTYYCWALDISYLLNIRKVSLFTQTNSDPNGAKSADHLDWVLMATQLMPIEYTLYAVKR